MLENEIDEAIAQLADKLEKFATLLRSPYLASNMVGTLIEASEDSVGALKNIQKVLQFQGR